MTNSIDKSKNTYDNQIYNSKVITRVSISLSEQITYSTMKSIYKYISVQGKLKPIKTIKAKIAMGKQSIFLILLPVGLANLQYT